MLWFCKEGAGKGGKGRKGWKGGNPSLPSFPTFSLAIHVINKVLDGEHSIASQCTNAPGIPDYNLSFYINVPNKPGHCSGWIDGKIQVPKGEWAHVAVTYDGKQFQTFVNGKLGTTYPASGEIQALQNHVRIAARGTGGVSAPFNGVIDEVKVWTVGLTEKEVIQSMESGQVVQPDNKLALTWGLIKIKSGR